MKKLIVLCAAVAVIVGFGTFATSVSAETTVTSDTYDNLPTGSISQTDLGAAHKVFSSSKFYAEGAELEIIEDGYKGKALKITEDGGSVWTLQTNDAIFSETQCTYITFKLCILDNADSTVNLPVKTGFDSLLLIQQNSGKDVLWTYGSNAKLPYELGEWYDVRVKYEVGRTEIEVENADGDVAKGYSSSAYKRLNFTASSAVAGVSIAIDEVNMYVVDLADDVDVLENSLPENIQSLSRMPEFDLRFNQPLSAGNAVVTIADELGNTVPSESYKVTPDGHLGIKVEFTGMLNKGADYTMKISGLKMWSGEVANDVYVEFTTEFAHKLTLTDKQVTTEGQKTVVTISFDGTMGYNSTPVRVMGIIYENGKMTSLEYKDANVDEDGKLIVDFDTIDADEPFSVLVFDSSNTLIPVSEAICFE